MADKINKYLKEVIEEKDDLGNVVKFTTSELIKVINDNYLNTNTIFEELDYENVGKKYSIPKCICKKTKIEYSLFFRNIFYDDTKLLIKPKIIDFIDLKEQSHIYEIYNINFIDKLIKELNFKNPVIITEQKEYPFNALNTKFYSWDNDFKIIDKDIIDYKDIFESNKVKEIKKCIDLSPNFKYYFKYPSPDDEFKFIISDCRDEISSNCLDDKITGLCGPMGIGKSTTLLALLTLKKNYCYFNIKALKDNEDQILIWKNKLLLSELAYAMKKNYKFSEFEILKEEIDTIFFFWDAIVKLVESLIKNEISMILILDQYKEKFDNNYYYIKKINDILKDDKNNYVRIIISSSINDKDVRISLLNKWLKEKDENIFTYKYYHYMIDVNRFLNIIKNDNSLSSLKKTMISEDFNSIPKFYYAIKSLKNDDEAKKYKLLQINKIKTSINDFFSNSVNIFEKLDILITLRGSFGQSLDNKEFKELVKILPFKYFSFILERNIIDFSFQLVKDIFDDFLSDKLCNFLKAPISSLKEGTIGDILELNLINDLKKNNFCTINQIINVNSIWDLNQYKTIFASEDFKTTILLLQESSEAKYIDFAILNNEKNLLLFQCKNALKKKPESYITKQIIEYNMGTLEKNFKEHLKVSLEKIYLFYVTGITFFKKDDKVMHRTWGVNEKENFKNNKIIAENAESELFYYDVINRKIYYENKNQYEPINDIIIHSEKFSSPILLKQKEDNKIIKDEINQLEVKEIAALKKKINKIERNCSTEFFSTKQKAYLKKNHADILNNQIIGSIKNPKKRDLDFQNMIGLKRKNRNYLLIEKSLNQEQKNVKIKESKKKIDIILENQEEENNTSLFLLKDDGLEEVGNIKNDFYDNIEYAYIFEKKIILKYN